MPTAQHPSTPQTATPQPTTPQVNFTPTGCNSSAWGNAPGTPANNISSPERATPRTNYTQARNLEQTIAGNAAELLA